MLSTLRRSALVLGALGTAVGLPQLVLTSLAGQAGAAPGGSLCQLAGTATFSPNGPGTSTSFAYSLTGTLSGCQSNITGAPASGSIAVGQVVTEAVTITTSTGPVAGTAQYQEPLATGTGTVPVNSCPSGATSGTAVTTWPDGTDTVAGYTTTSAGAGVNLQGTVVAGVALQLVAGSESPAGTAPATFTISSDNAAYPAGAGVQGVLAFTTSNPQACTTASGLTDASVQGQVGLGHT